VCGAGDYGNRTIESKRDRIATILIAPFMTCSARLPVYTMVIAAFLPHVRCWAFFWATCGSDAGFVCSGFLMAVLTARLLKSTILKSKDAPFILEMPPYRWPVPASLALRVVDRGKAFLYRAGTVIMLVSLLLWAATNFPMHHGQPPEIQNSVVAQLGHAIEPVIRPLGFDWKIGVGLLTSLRRAK